MEITSITNEKVKRLKKLISDKAYRYEQGQFVVEGIRALDGIKDIFELYVLEGAKPPEGLKNAPKAFVLGTKVFESISSTENSQGVIAVVKMNVLGPSSILKSSRYVFFDKLQDPGNVGAIIRTACALGFQGVIINPGCVDPFSPKAARAAAGSLWKMDVIKIENIEDFSNIEIIAADKNGEDAGGFKWPEGFALAIGNEGAGISDEVKNLARSRVGIPIRGDIESLNASVSAGILMYLSTIK